MFDGAKFEWARRDFLGALASGADLRAFPARFYELARRAENVGHARASYVAADGSAMDQVSDPSIPTFDAGSAVHLGPLLAADTRLLLELAHGTSASTLTTNLEHVLPTTRARVLTRVGRRDEAERVLAMLAPSRIQAVKAAFPLDFARAYQRDAGPYR